MAGMQQEQGSRARPFLLVFVQQEGRTQPPDTQSKGTKMLPCPLAENLEMVK